MPVGKVPAANVPCWAKNGAAFVNVPIAPSPVGPK
jgi:hypothetical protein